MNIGSTDCPLPTNQLHTTTWIHLPLSGPRSAAVQEPTWKQQKQQQKQQQPTSFHGVIHCMEAGISQLLPLQGENEKEEEEEEVFKNYS